MGYGDEILAAGQAQSLYDRTGLKSVVVDKDYKQRWHPIWDGNPIILKEGNREPPQRVHQIVNAPGCRPYIIYPFTEDTGWTFNRTFRARDHIAKIYLTDGERQLGQQVADHRRPFVLIDPWSKHPNLRWPLDHWQQLVASWPFGRYRLVQHVYAGAPRLSGVEYIETPSFRQACSVLARATLYIRGESGMCHAAAALGIPQVTIWGSCMDWDVLGNYPRQVGVGVVFGSLQACGSWRPCVQCQLAMSAITVDKVKRAVELQLACWANPS